MATEKRPIEPFFRARGQEDADALVHGKNPAFLIEKIVRERILDSLYYRDQCFGLDAATILDRAVALDCVGGSHGASRNKPTEFVCLALKFLQLFPAREILLAYLQDETFKYLRALAAFVIRLTFPEKEVYLTLEPLMTDYRKLRVRAGEGYTLEYMDTYIDMLLTQPRVFEMALPPMLTRQQLEDMDELESRESPLQAELDADDQETDSHGTDDD
ncbi:hypothetical protein PYCC9005_004106 [Savitreella phatthalungensis]